MAEIKCPYSLTALRQLSRQLRTIYDRFSSEDYRDKSYEHDTEIISEISYIKTDLNNFAYDLPFFSDYLEEKRTNLSIFRKARFSKRKSMSEEENKILEKPNLNLPKDLELVNAFIATEFYISNLASLLGQYMTFTESINTLYQQRGTYCPTGFKITTSEDSGDKQKFSKKAEDIAKTFLNLEAIDFTEFIAYMKDPYKPKEESQALPKLRESEYYEKFYPLKIIVDFAKSYREDIYKLTFATRAEFAIKAKNEKIKLNNSRYNQKTPKITKKYFIEISGLEKTSISNYFIGKTLPNTEFLLLLSNSLNVSVNYLLDPTTKVATFKSELNDLDYSFVMTQESEFILRLLNGLWAPVGTVKADQADLIQHTLDFLIRDIFQDYSGDAKLPTVDRDINLGLCKENSNFQDLYLRLKEGTLRFNRESLLFLIGRFIFDPYKTNLERPKELSGPISVVGTDMLHQLWNTLDKDDMEVGDLKKAIGEFIERNNELYDLDYSDTTEYNISQYLMENILNKVRESLNLYQEKFRKGNLANKLNYQPTYPTDYDETKDKIIGKTAEDKHSEPKSLNLGFSDTYPPAPTAEISSMINTLRLAGYAVSMPTPNKNPLPDHWEAPGESLEDTEE